MLRSARCLSVLVVSAAGLLAMAAPVRADGPARYPAQGASFGEWMDRLQPVLKSCRMDFNAAVPPGQPGRVVHRPYDWRHETQFLFVLPEASPTVDWEAVPGGGALVMAAEYYVLASGDLSPTLGEVEQSGWWPYATIPAGMDRTLPITDSARHGWPIQDKYLILKNIGSPAWVNYARNQILEYFYTSFFFDQAHGMRQVGELPAQLPQFWAAPDTGAAYQAYAPGSGLASGYQVLDANGFLTGGMATMVPGAIGGRLASPELQSTPPDKRPVPLVVAYAEATPGWNTKAGLKPPLLLADCQTRAGENELQPAKPRTEDNPTPYASPGYLDGLRSILLPVQNNPQFLFDVKLDDSGERAPIEQLPCPLALELAAKYYAIATLDNQVSLRDLVESGFWPYDTFPAALDLSETLYAFPRNIEADIYYSSGTAASGPDGQPLPARFSGSLATMLGSREWLLWRKAEILNEAHAELYFEPARDFVPREGVDARQQDVLPRFAAFWADPLAADEAGVMPEFTFGRQAGQLSLVDVNLLRPQFEGARLSYRQQVPLINLADKADDNGVNCCVMLTQRVAVQGVEQSYAQPLPASIGGGMGEVRWVYDEPVVRQAAVLLDTGWRSARYAGLSQADAAKQEWGQAAIFGPALYPAGVRPGYAMFSGQDLEMRPRVIYNTVEPSLARAGLKSWQLPALNGYAFVGSMGGLVPAFVQVPQKPCGVDWLAEAPAASPASLTAN
jgi:hypothetical protein